MKPFQIWDSHVHLFPPEIYQNWDKYAAMDETFANLTRKPANGKGTEEAWVNIEEALACADEAGVWGLGMQGWYWNDPGLMRLHNDYMAEALKKYPDRLRGFISVNPKFGREALDEIERCPWDFRGSENWDREETATILKIPVLRLFWNAPWRMTFRCAFTAVSRWGINIRGKI